MPMMLHASMTLQFAASGLGDQGVAFSPWIDPNLCDLFVFEAFKERDADLRRHIDRRHVDRLWNVHH